MEKRCSMSIFMTLTINGPFSAYLKSGPCVFVRARRRSKRTFYRFRNIFLLPKKKKEKYICFKLEDV